MSHNSKRDQADSQPKKKEPRLHKTGQWYVSVRGIFHYFGRDKVAAFEEWYRVKDHLLAGENPPPKLGRPSLTVGRLCNLFLDYKQGRLDTGELTAWTFTDWRGICTRIIEYFQFGKAVESLTPGDFLGFRAYLAERLKSLQVLGFWISRAKSVFRFAYDNAEIEAPVRFGVGFKGPSKTAVRMQKNEREARHGKKLFTPEQITSLMAAANVHLRAMIVLGINCGFNNADCGTLPLVAVDLAAARISYARNKTAVARDYLPLWPESVQCLKDSLAARPEPVEPAADSAVFVTKAGAAYHDETRRRNPITRNFSRLIRRENIFRPGLSFLTLRHTFQTVGENLTTDTIAVKAVMGHVDGTMSGEYREGVSRDRIDAVIDAIRGWLFPCAADRWKIFIPRSG